MPYKDIEKRKEHDRNYYIRVGKKKYIPHPLPKIIVNCLSCNKEFRTNPYKIKLGFGKYCSRICHGLSTRGRIFTEEWKKKLSNARIGKRLSEETKKRMSESAKIANTPEVRKKKSESNKGKKCPWVKLPHFSGEKSANWKGGITPLNRLIRTSLKMKQWREAVYKRDDYRCMDCGERGRKLNADHILQFSKFPRLRFVLENGQTLCEPCHLQKTIFERVGKMELSSLIY